MEPLSGRVVGRLVGALVVGVLVGLVGTVVHRHTPPLGLALALACVVAAAVLARAWAGWAGVLATGLGVVTVVGVLGSRGPGGDVLIAAEPIGWAWYAGGLLVLLAGVAPRRWFDDRPLRLGDRGDRARPGATTPPVG